MSAEEYWHGDPSLIFNYEQSYINRRKLKEQQLWLQGAYFRSALQSVVVAVGFADKSTAAKLPDYPPQPFTDERGGASEDADAESRRAGAYFDALMRANNKE